MSRLTFSSLLASIWNLCWPTFSFIFHTPVLCRCFVNCLMLDKRLLLFVQTPHAPILFFSVLIFSQVIVNPKGQGCDHLDVQGRSLFHHHIFRPQPVSSLQDTILIYLCNDQCSMFFWLLVVIMFGLCVLRFPLTSVFIVKPSLERLLTMT